MRAAKARQAVTRSTPITSRLPVAVRPMHAHIAVAVVADAIDAGVGVGAVSAVLGGVCHARAGGVARLADRAGRSAVCVAAVRLRVGGGQAGGSTEEGQRKLT